MATISTQKCLSGLTLFIGQDILKPIFNLLKENVKHVYDLDDILTVCSDMYIDDWDGLDDLTRSWFVVTMLNIHDNMLVGREEEFITAFSNEGIKIAFDTVANCYLPVNACNGQTKLTEQYFKKQV